MTVCSVVLTHIYQLPKYANIFLQIHYLYTKVKQKRNLKMLKKVRINPGSVPFCTRGLAAFYPVFHVNPFISFCVFDILSLNYEFKKWGSGIPPQEEDILKITVSYEVIRNDHRWR